MESEKPDHPAILKRPDPELLLRQFKKNPKMGKLKIFFGACAGAGKTYAMLSEAQEKKSLNIDVVAGIIETHGRSETAKLLTGLPRLPLREIKYHNILLKEFDLDAAIKREPTILLIDELAHSNSMESRHPKRWQDVEELLEAGIDVYTTLNVQHLESLNDLVAELTGIKVKETVPDSIFDHADEIVLVDIPSEVILQRLNEGKVYLGEFIKQRAASNFFKIENLIALREIALRRTAERVDALRDTYKKYQHGQQVLSDKILVCIDKGPVATKLIRQAKQLALRLRAPWIALHVENDAYYRLSKLDQKFIKQNLTLAEQLGAKVETRQETNTASAILEAARLNHVNKIMVGYTLKSKWKLSFTSSLVNQILNNSHNIDVYIIHEDSVPAPTLKKFNIEFSLPSYFYAILMVVFVTLIGLPFREWLTPETMLLVFLTGVITVSISYNFGACLLAILFSMISYHLFFVDPFHFFGMDPLRNVIALGLFFFLAILTSKQTERLRQQNFFSKQRAKYMSDLYALSRQLIMTPGKVKLSKVVSQVVGEIFNCSATIWIPNEIGHLELFSHPGIKANLKEESVAHWAFKHNQVAGLGTNTMPSAKGYYLPLANADEVYGVLGVIPREQEKSFSAEEHSLLESLALQTATAFQRAKIAETMLKDPKPSPEAK